MGLGKTVQALALLGTIKGRKLVVAPSSLLTNWQREAERFLPGARVLVLSGAQRHEKFAREWAAADLVITSYPLLRLDAERLCADKFAAVILDEAHQLPDTLRRAPARGPFLLLGATFATRWNAAHRNPPPPR